MTIKEFSKLSGVDSTTLRYWDEIGVFSPAHRSEENNYRYYTKKQLITLYFVTALSELKFPLKTIAALDNDRNPEEFLRLISAQEQLLNNELSRLRMCYAIIHARRELINHGQAVQNYPRVSVRHMEDKPILLGPRNIYKKGENFMHLLPSLVKSAKDLRMNLSFPIGGYYDSFEDFLEHPQQPFHFFTIDPSGNNRRKKGDYLMGFNFGDYGEFDSLPEDMKTYALENSIVPKGAVYVTYLYDELCVKNPEDYLAQVCVGL